MWTERSQSDESQAKAIAVEEVICKKNVEECIIVMTRFEDDLS